MYSASYPTNLENGILGSGNFIRQLAFGVIGVVFMTIVIILKTDVLKKISPVFYVLSIILLIAVLFIGVEVNGNKAWIQLPGGFRFQPTELAKISIVLTLATVISIKPWSINGYKELLKFGPYFYMGILAALILGQKDLGSLLVFGIACLSIVGFAGAKRTLYIVPAALLLILGTVFILTGHRAGRVKAWFDPFSTSREIVQYTYQPKNSLIAIGSGGWFGRGFTMSRQKWGFLPEPHNDYILAIIAEEVGFVGILIFIILPYGIIIYRGFLIAEKARDTFSTLLAGGATIMLAVQALINMAVVTNLLPCIGITLPFISYGGTSFVSSLVLAGLILNVSNNTNVSTTKRQEIYNKQRSVNDKGRSKTAVWK